MKSELETLLSDHGQTLLHAVDAGEGAPSKGKGGGKFDESKVKRDKGGKFSKQAMAKNLDALWGDKSMLENFKYNMLMKHAKTLREMSLAWGKANGFSEKEMRNMADPTEHPDFVKSVVETLNKESFKDGAVSPSGSQRIEFFVDGKKKEIGVRSVPYSGPNPHPEATRRLQEQYKDVQRVNRASARDDDGLFFNPDATLDTSRISDADDVTSDAGDRVNSSIARAAQEIKRSVSHEEELVGEFLAHFGVKGMRWGVRKDRVPTEQTRNTANVDAYINRSPLQALSTKGTISLKERKALEKEADDLLLKDLDTRDRKVTALGDEMDSAQEALISSFEKTTSGRVPTEKEVSDLHTKMHDVEERYQRAMDEVQFAVIDPKVADVVNRVMTAETRWDVYKARAGVLGRAAALATGTSLVLHSETGDSLEVDLDSLSHAQNPNEKKVAEKLKAMEAKYGDKFFQMPLMEYVKSVPASQQVRMMKSIVSDIKNLRVLAAKTPVEMAHAFGLSKVWDETKAVRDGLGQFTAKVTGPESGELFPESLSEFGNWIDENVYGVNSDGSPIDPYGSPLFEPVIDKISDSGNWIDRNIYRVNSDGTPIDVTYESANLFDLVPIPSVAAYTAKTEKLRHVDDFIAHYGTKGMKWGVRRDLSRLTPGAQRSEYLAKKDAKWLAKVDSNPKLGKISAKAAREAKRQTKKLKKDYKDRGLNIKKDSFARSRYDTELKGILENSLDQASYKVHKYPPSRLMEVAIHRHPDGTITAMVRPRSNAKIVKQQGKIAKADVRAEKKAAKAGIQHADMTLDREDDFEDLQFKITVDEEGFVDDISTASDVMAHQDEVNSFLAHYGIKGMRWGVRRSDAQLDKLDGGGSKPSKRTDNVDTDGDGKNDTRLSADAERFVNTLEKEGVEMSTREMKEAVERYNQVQKYNQIFNADPKSELQQKVEDLRLQKELKDLKAEMTPQKMAATQKFISAAAGGYKAYQTIDATFEGALTKGLSKKLGLVDPPSKTDLLKAENEALNLTATNIRSKTEIASLTKLRNDALRADPPSRATDYSGAGKRRATGRRSTPFDSNPTRGTNPHERGSSEWYYFENRRRDG